MSILMDLQKNETQKAVFLSVLSEQTKQSLVPIIRVIVPNVAIRTFKSLVQAVEDCIKSEESAGTMFIEFGYPLEELSSHLHTLRQTKDKKPEKIILLIDQEDISEDLISKYLRIGFSGIVTKPFSEKSVHDVFKISERLSSMGSVARLKVATGLQIKSMLEQKGQKFEESSILSAVKKACQQFEESNPGNSLENLAESYAKLNPKERIGKSIKDFYKGPSERVKKLLHEGK
jgi:hypothetical protein